MQTATRTLKWWLVLMLSVHVCSLAESRQALSDSTIEASMGTPFPSGRILPTPRQVKYEDAYLNLFDGSNGMVLCEPMFEYRAIFLKCGPRGFSAQERTMKGWSTDWRLCFS